MIFTGINPPSLRDDLNDRTLKIELQSVPAERRREEGEFWASVEAARPMLFGALLDAIAKTLQALPRIRPERLPRMAAFARIGAAMAEALGYGQDAFLSVYDRNNQRHAAEVLQQRPTRDRGRAVHRRAPRRVGRHDGRVVRRARHPVAAGPKRGAPPERRMAGSPAQACCARQLIST